MRLLDDEKRLFGIVNPIDGLIVVAGIVAVAVVANILFGVDPRTIGAAHGNRKIEMVVRAEKVRDFDPSYLSVGDKVIKVGGAKVMGTVASVRSEKALEEEVDNSGAPHVYRSDVEKDVYITVDGTGAINEDGVFMGDEQVRVNMLFDLAASRWEAEECRVVSVKAAD